MSQGWMATYGSLIFVGVPMMMYVAQAAFVYFAQHRYGMCLTMGAYALANVGIILDSKGF